MTMRHRQGTTRTEIVSRRVLYVYGGMVMIFLIAPIGVIIPISFTNDIFLTYPIQAFSTRWYEAFMGSPQWMSSLYNSLVIAVSTTILATVLGTLAAIGLTQPSLPFRSTIMAVIVSPMILPPIVVGIGMYFLYSPIGMVGSHLGVILAHTTLALPFVVLVGVAALQGLDVSLVQAAQNLGASRLTTFRLITLPLILPGVAAGAIFAFATSFDEIVITMIIGGAAQRTLPIQMYSGVREQLSPTITAVATVLIVMSLFLMLLVELLHRRLQRQAR